MNINLPAAFNVSLFADNIFEIVLPFIAIQAVFCAYLIIKKAASRL